MYIFIIQIILMLSLGTMIYLIARAAPRVSDEIISEAGKQFTKFDKLFSFLRLEKIDPILHNFLEKLLRKTKLILMKLDSIVNNYLNKIKKYKSGNLGNNNGKDGEEKQNLFDGSASLTINSEQGRRIDNKIEEPVLPADEGEGGK